MTNDVGSLRVDGARLWASLDRMAEIGATPRGGVCRLALSELDRESRDLFVAWAREAGCTIRVDRMGNVFARRAGRVADAAPVMTGSHADTQPTGGRYDGIYGVLGGLEVVRALNDAGIETERPVEVVLWTNEEGSRFAPVPFAPRCIEAVREAAAGLGLSHQDIISGAGHDACYLARVAPTGMIFVPCIDGLSHNEAEAITPAWAEAGANVLLHAVLASAMEPVTDGV